MNVHDDDPGMALQQALLGDDREKILGGYRLLDAAGRQVDLSQELALKLAELLEQAEMFRDAARIYRVAAEKDLESETAPAAIFRSALLLLGPAHRPQPGADMLLYLVANYPGHEKSPVAEKIHDRHMNGDAAGLAQCLLEEASSRRTTAPPSATDAWPFRRGRMRRSPSTRAGSPTGAGIWPAGYQCRPSAGCRGSWASPSWHSCACT